MAKKKSRKTGKNVAGARTGPDQIKKPSTKKAKQTQNVTSEYKRYLECLRRTIIPKSVMHDYVERRLNNKMDKYENLFITGCYDSEPSEKSIQLTDPECTDEQKRNNSKLSILGDT